MFGFGKGKNTVNDTKVQDNIKDFKVNLLKEREQKFTVSLKKKTDMNIVVQVGLVIDVSGSMSNLFNNNTVQDVVERIFPIAKKFDDNGMLDMWAFSNSFNRLRLVNDDNFYTYVKTQILDKQPDCMWGGTSYGPVMDDVVKFYQKPKDPAYIIFITDGNNNDKHIAESILKKASDKPIFWQFVGIGNSSFDFLEKLDDLKDRFIDNASFIPIKDINTMNDETLYDLLMTEFPDWLKLAKSHKLI